MTDIETETEASTSNVEVHYLPNNLPLLVGENALAVGQEMGFSFFYFLGSHEEEVGVGQNKKTVTRLQVYKSVSNLIGKAVVASNDPGIHQVLAGL